MSRNEETNREIILARVWVDLPKAAPAEREECETALSQG